MILSQSGQPNFMLNPLAMIQANGLMGQPQQSGGIGGLLGNPLFNVGMGLLSANSRSFTPPNYAQSVMNSLMMGQSMKRQMEQDKLREQYMKSQMTPERKIIKGADGYSYYADTGERVLPNVEKQIDPNKLINEDGTLNQEYFDAQVALKQAGKSETNFHTYLGGENLTPGQKAVDEAFAKDIYVPFVSGGGQADAEKNISQLKYARETLNSGADLTGPVTGTMPDMIRYFTNPESINTREAVEEVVQRNLREVLGAQFTEKEGERLISRAYNEKLSEEQNAQRLSRLIEQIEKAYASKIDAAKYFEEKGTLRGWEGKRYTFSDFEDALNEKQTPQTQENDPLGIR